MIAEAVQTKRISLEEYFEMEYNSEARHEFINGKTRPMSYASEHHRHICSNLNRLIGNSLYDKEESVFTNQTLLFTPACNKGYYPDVTVFPPEIEYKEYRGKMKAALNPSVIIEVLSDSTEHIDRGEKWQCYQTIPSLKQYFLISQNEMRVESFSRHNGQKEWLYTDWSNEDDKIKLGDILLPMKEIYHKVKFAEAKTDDAPPQ